MTKNEWKQKMLNPSVWGDDVVLHLASNLLEVNIHVIHAFPESNGVNNGVDIIKPLNGSSQKQLIYMFYFSDSDFSPAHYQSVWPSSLPPSLPHFPPPSQDVEVTEVISFNQDNQLMSELEITAVQKKVVSEIFKLW